MTAAGGDRAASERLPRPGQSEPHAGAITMNMIANSGNDNSGLPVVAGVEITTDTDGRFNLNALHRASGGEPGKAPAQWLRTQQAQELIAALEGQSPETGSGEETVQKCIVSQPGRSGGTFAAEELAVSYAGWISPAFQLTVNRTFIAYRKSDLPPPATPAGRMTLAEAREARLQFQRSHWLAKQLGLVGGQAVLSANRATRALTDVDMVALLGVTTFPAAEQEQLLTPGDIGARLGGWSARDVNLALTAGGYQVSYRDAKGRLYYEPTAQGRDAGGVMVEVEKQQKTGAPVRQLRWASRIVDLLRPILPAETVASARRRATAAKERV